MRSAIFAVQLLLLFRYAIKGDFIYCYTSIKCKKLNEYIVRIYRKIINYNRNIKIDYLRSASEPRPMKLAPSESAVAVPTTKKHITEEKIH